MRGVTNQLQIAMVVPTLVPAMIVVRVGEISQLLPIGAEALLRIAVSMMTLRDLRVGAITMTRRARGIIAREVAAQAVAHTHEAAAPAIRESEIASEVILAEIEGETQSLPGSRACCMNKNSNLDTQSSRRGSTRQNGSHRDMVRVNKKSNKKTPADLWISRNLASRNKILRNNESNTRDHHLNRLNTLAPNLILPRCIISLKFRPLSQSINSSNPSPTFSPTLTQAIKIQ